MRSFGLLCVLSLVACDDVENPTDVVNPEEVITTVDLTFTPEGGGAATTFTWTDPENDGSPVVDEIVLAVGTYTMDVAFSNALENPPEDITPEVADEADEHQVFVVGSSVVTVGTGGDARPADPAPVLLTHSYDDMDAGGLPLGLTNTVVVGDVGSGDLRIVLQHLPEVDGAPQKVAGLAETAATSVAQLPGESDVDVMFDVRVE